MLTISEVLLRAAAHMEDVGHHRGAYSERCIDDPCDVWPVCVEGAIQFVCTGDPWRTDDISHKTVDALEGWLHEQEPPVLAAVHTWSDRERTPIVIASLRAAAADLDQP